MHRVSSFQSGPGLRRADPSARRRSSVLYGLALFLSLAAYPTHPCAAQPEAQQGVRFLEGGWETALAAARESGKHVFVDAYTEWCGWCRHMDRHTFSDAEVAAFIERHFVPVKFDMEEGDGLRLALKFRVTGFPTYLVFSPEGRLVYRLFGYLPSAEFIDAMRTALDPAAQLDLQGIGPDIDLPFPDFYRSVAMKGQERIWPTDSTVATFLDGREDWSDEVSWSVITRFGGGDRGRRYLLDNHGMLARLYGKDEVDRQLFTILWQRMERAALQRSRGGLDSVLAQCDTLFLADAASQRWWLELNYCSVAEDWAALARSMDVYLDTAGTVPHGTVNDFSWRMYEHCADTAALERALVWMARVTTEKPTYMYLDTQAALLYKTARYDEAEREAIRAIEAGNKEGENVTATENLLENIRSRKDADSPVIIPH
jgi:thioredoxin-related protein